MLPFKKILFPVDFSDRARGAAHFVEAMAGRFESEITLFHVVETSDYLYGSLEFGATALASFHTERIAQLRRELDLFLADELKMFDVRRVLVEGDPAHEIVRYAHEDKSHLIMMPSHGFGPFRRFIIGSVTAKVLHDAECPVWTGVHMEQAPPLEAITCRNVLCAIDLGPQSEHTLAFANRLADEYGAALTIVHATPAVEARPARYLDTELFVSFVQQAKAEIAKLQEKVGSKAQVCIEGGDPAAVVRYSAEQHHADALVIARGSAGHFGRLRTHAYSIIRQSPCPVISV